jgi:hypothetical protein
MTVPSGRPNVEAAPDHDIIWGATSIANEINVSRRKAFYLLERGLIPAKKIGDSWVSTRSALRAALKAAS